MHTLNILKLLQFACFSGALMTLTALAVSLAR